MSEDRPDGPGSDLPGSDAALSVALVGPTHPYKGGVAAHTTTLAHELSEAGHDVALVSWSHLYPARLYPGEQAVPGGSPDVTPYPRSMRVLSWARPDTWVRTGRRLRDVDVVVLVHVVPAVVPAHLALLRAAGAGRRDGRRGPAVVVVAHNVLPHEPHPGDRRLVGALLAAADAVVVHSGEQARLAAELGARRVREVDLPPHLPGGPRVDRPAHDGPVRLLALGIVRDYKGLDLLVEAVREVEGVTLTVAGELWGEAGRRVRDLAADPRLRGRVEVHGGYVPADRIAGLMARHDVLALPYRSATASQNVLLAQRHGLPVLATSVGTFADQVRDGVDGVLAAPGDRDALVTALRRLTGPGAVAALADGVREPDLDRAWANYVGAVEALAAAPTVWDDDEPAAVPLGRVARVRAAVAGLRARRGPVLELSPVDLPDELRATDLLTVDAEAVDAQEVARLLGLPRAKDPVAAWAALGAVAALVRVLDDRSRTAVVVDESGSGSPFSRWTRALGFAPVELELTGRRAAVEVLDVDTASLDVVARLHPGGCTASDVDLVVGQASWTLRTGGLLLLTVPIGDDDPEFAVRPADVRGILARADDLGLTLVGDVDGDVLGRMAQARSSFGGSGSPAYAVLRLTFRRK
ncbi:glycosyltransferase family 4 protein [Phycicoccus sp. BSK3Z-2]|uniref:D-inositol 3-phosphate glycosyltransferase n=1 Tax=Phycicoccus avicenniae TaxID=2828860 RepID=A0A941D8J0_9MICO|nr:glycosyltransferase [Phycicoccus avicenniae]MBR7743456.1 glycosyltransferase family 4 protein [Phycicoccus avicenniae]MBR7743940.1 glycosyltransferase family 4 protein [Phycicoccus avicenniae]